MGVSYPVLAVHVFALVSFGAERYLVVGDQPDHGVLHRVLVSLLRCLAVLKLQQTQFHRDRTSVPTSAALAHLLVGKQGIHRGM